MIIEIERLSKTYKKNFKTVKALKEIGFTVEPNRILGILGPNGAGKTTLLKILTGIIQPDNTTGAVRLFGSGDINAVKHRTGFLPENPEFFRNISAYELLAFAQKITGAAHDKKRILDLLEQVNLSREKGERVKNFSKGMRQRIGIAQAIIHHPELLILDEPMSGLDPPGRRMVIDLIQNYRDEGKTILFSTHNLDDIEALCTDVMVLNHGEIKLERKIADLREKSTYKIEVESADGKETLHAADRADLWNVLEKAKEQDKHIVRVQSGIADQLETFYRAGNEKHTPGRIGTQQ